MAKIAIDAGHGRYTAGKRCLKKLDKNETREWVLNDRIASYLEDYLKSAGHEILRVDDTTGKRDVPLAERVSKAEKWGADIYVSIHHDSGIQGKSGGGTTIFISTHASKKSKQVQHAIYNRHIEYAKLKGNRSDGTRTADFYVLVHTNIPAVLIENGFMDSRTDIKKILDPAWSKKAAFGIAKGVCDIYGGKVGGISIVNKKPTKKPSTSKTIKVGNKVKYSGYVYRDSVGKGRGAKISGNYIVSLRNSNKYGVHLKGYGWVKPTECKKL